MSSRWIEKRRRDQFYKLAKAKGYRSRSSFKLLQANRSYRFIKHGRNVVDLGAAPGGWLQVTREAVGESGFVLGVDKQEIKPFSWRNVVTIVADVEDASLPDRIREAMPGPVDVVLSDVSPDLTGVWDLDQARQVHLANQCLEIAQRLLRKGGNFFVKAFHGADLPDFKTRLRESFQTVRIVKPPASRSDSSEIYFLGLNYSGERRPPSSPEEPLDGPVSEHTAAMRP
ncbi:RlmE family RNA methyltransferase [[Eubacterium] cellulosolvens]